MKLKEYDDLGYRFRVTIREDLPFPELSSLKWIERILSELENAIELKKWFESNLEEIFKFDK